MDSTKLCECGCGQPTPIAKRTNRRLGYVRGQPVRYLPSHRGQQRRPTEELFWSHVQKTETCWLWTSTTAKGYGVLRSYHNPAKPRAREYAHRYSWRLHSGLSIPTGLWVLHRCDNPRCVRPDHLFLGNQKDNMQDMVNKGRYGHIDYATHPPRHGGQHGNAVLTEKTATELVMLYRAGVRQAEIARRLHISSSLVWDIVHRKGWRHLQVWDE